MSNIWNRTAVAFIAVLFPAAALADISSTTPATITAGGSFSLDSGANVSSGGDISLSGASLTFVGSAKGGSLAALGVSGASAYASITQAELTALASLATNTPIPLASLSVNTILGVATNGGNPAKLLVTAIIASPSTATFSISFQYTTYISTTPTITGVQNNYSYITPGLPNYGIAQGSLFIIKGSVLASATTVSSLQDPSIGIPTSLNGASIKVTVGGVTTTPGIYYAIATQIAAVLPSNTPVGTGTVTVTYNNTASNAQSIVVVPSALGLDTYYGTGSGLGVATNPTTGALYNYTNSIPPGTTVVLWGSGLGSTGDSDTTNTSTPHAVSNPPTFYVGGIAVTPLYAGRSVYPGVNQVNLTIPASAPTGCGISVVAVNGSGSASIVSNSVTLPIGSGVCSDPALGYNGSQLGSGTQAGTYTTAIVSIGQGTSPQQGEVTYVSGIFERITTTSASAPTSILSLGSCFISLPGSVAGSLPTITGLDAGTLTVTGPAGSQTLSELKNPLTNALTGDYSMQVANSFLPATGGSFTFTGSGGADVGAFSASVSLGNVISWTNMSSISTVARASGQSVTWSGGTPNSYVYISGTSSSSSGASATFVCYAPVSAGQLTVPNYILLALPPGTGTLGVANSATPASFTASGLTAAGVADASVSFAINATYQ